MNIVQNYYGSKERKSEVEFRPLNENYLIKPRKAADKQGEIYLPDNAKKKTTDGTVLAVFLPYFDAKGIKRTPSARVGDRVFFSAYAGTEVEYDGEKLLVIPESELLAREE